MWQRVQSFFFPLSWLPLFLTQTNLSLALHPHQHLHLLPFCPLPQPLTASSTTTPLTQPLLPSTYNPTAQPLPPPLLLHPTTSPPLHQHPYHAQLIPRLLAVPQPPPLHTHKHTSSTTSANLQLSGKLNINTNRTFSNLRLRSLRQTHSIILALTRVESVKQVGT